MNYNIFGYIGIFCAMIYKLPQIKKIYNTKKGEDISKKTYIIHNCSYICLIVYLFNKSELDYLLICYEFFGLSQNLIILSLKMKYKNIDIKKNEIQTKKQQIVLE
jgi:uncharacterized protein with PQ loop repeat